MIASLVDHLWQSTLFAVVAALFAPLLRNNAARVRHGVWLAASVKFLIPFSWLTLLGAQLAPQQGSSASLMPESFSFAVQQIAEPLGAPAIVMRSPPSAGSPIGETLPALLRDQLGLTTEPRDEAMDVVVVDSMQAPALGAASASNASRADVRS